MDRHQSASCLVECMPMTIRMSATVLALLCAALGATAHAADLEVEVRNVKPRRGELRAALFDSAEDFQAGTKIRAMVSDGQITSGVFTREGDFAREPVTTIQVPAEGRSMTLRIPDLEPGEYALGVYQDINGDEKLDITLGGLSLEPWGVSNDAGSLDSDPRWEDARFQLPAEGGRIVINLRDEKQEKRQEEAR
jgi:uncharacterized protein (DUF2141 family)